MKICTEKLGDEVTRIELIPNIRASNLVVSTYRSSRGEMKMSLREMTLIACQYPSPCSRSRETHILMFEVFQQLQLSVGSLGQYWGTEWLHDLLYGDILVGELIPSRAMPVFRKCQLQTIKV
jgi:hypothetical protein